MVELDEEREMDGMTKREREVAYDPYEEVTHARIQLRRRVLSTLTCARRHNNHRYAIVRDNWHNRAVRIFVLCFALPCVPAGVH